MRARWMYTYVIYICDMYTYCIYVTYIHIGTNVWQMRARVNPKSTSNQSSKPCTVLQYPSKQKKKVYSAAVPIKKMNTHCNECVANLYMREMYICDMYTRYICVRNGVHMCENVYMWHIYTLYMCEERCIYICVRNGVERNGVHMWRYICVRNGVHMYVREMVYIDVTSVLYMLYTLYMCVCVRNGVHNGVDMYVWEMV